MDAKKSDDDEARKTEAWLSSLEDQLTDLESARGVKGLTPQDLADKGFVGGKAIDLNQTRFKEVSEKEKLEFESGIEPYRLPTGEAFEHLEIATLDHLRDVAAGEEIARRRVDESIPIKEGRNVKKEIAGGVEFFKAMVKGKVVIHRECLHIFPTDIDARFKIRLSPDKMSAFLDCTPSHGEGRALETAAVLEGLKKMGVVYGIDVQAVAKAVETANGLAARQENIEAARGVASQSGAHGEIDFKFNTHSKQQEFKVLPDGRVDYKSMGNIILAGKGKLLAEIAAAGKGTPGKDVTGATLLAETGRDASLAAGRGIKKSADGRQFFADLDGCVILNGGLLEVMSLYVVNSDVDYSTGNIHFNGTVIVNGNVLEGFEVRAEGDVIVKKNAEGARILAGRDAEVHGGIQGKSTGLVSAGRDIRTEFAQNARLEAQGNVYISNFAVNSHIFASKFLRMQEKRGALIGGETFAQRGIDVKMLGSGGGTKTSVEVGSDFLVRRKLNELDEAIAFCEQNAKKIDDRLHQAAVLFKAKPALVAAKAPLVQKTMEKRNELLQQKNGMLAKREDLMASLHEKEVCFVKVSGTCHGDVFLKFRELKTAITRPRDAVRFYADVKAGEIKAAPY